MPGSEPPTPALRDVPLTLERVFPQREWRAGEATAWMSERNLLLKLADVFEAQGRVPSDRELDVWLTTPCITCRVRASGGFYIKPVAPIDLAVLGHDEVVITAFSESLRLSAAYREDHLDRRRLVFQNLVVLVVDGMVRSPAPPALATFVETLQTELDVAEHTRAQLLEQCDRYVQKLSAALASAGEEPVHDASD